MHIYLDYIFEKIFYFEKYIYFFIKKYLIFFIKNYLRKKQTKTDIHKREHKQRVLRKSAIHENTGSNNKEQNKNTERKSKLSDHCHLQYNTSQVTKSQTQQVQCT